ncbi:WecE Predicted pyridoxal phosphate-dependent enzyme apparently involved in regulation of cell wall biogenesis [Candidatus Methylopumilus universalis]|uniref:LegC family aminotransferase n=1 Tax=Candidatus Methylopumilus universalis TaxID=2588536 RepID=UPI003BEED3F6
MSIINIKDVQIKTLAERIVLAIREIAGPGPAALHEPSFAGNEWLYLKECLDSTFVSSVGKFVDRFESDLAMFTGAKYAISVVNGTAALHIALKLAGVKANDEVLIPALTFVASANAVTYCNAIPHFVDSENETLGVNVSKLRDYLISHTEQRAGCCINLTSGRVIRALVPTHVFGHPADLDGLLAIAHDFNINLIEDAAESLGSYYHDQHTGTFGLLGVLSFNGNKTITTGGGGAILTNNLALARHAKHLTTTAKLPHLWEYYHDEIGYNYRLPNLNAALGCAQLEQLPSILSAKRELFIKYQNVFAKIEGITLMAEPAQSYSNYWLQTLLLDSNLIVKRDEILQATNDSGYMTRPAWILLNKLESFKQYPRMNLETALLLSKCLINIPSSPGLNKNNG